MDNKKVAKELVEVAKLLTSAKELTPKEIKALKKDFYGDAMTFGGGWGGSLKSAQKRIREGLKSDSAYDIESGIATFYQVVTAMMKRFTPMADKARKLYPKIKKPPKI